MARVTQEPAFDNFDLLTANEPDEGSDEWVDFRLLLAIAPKAALNKGKEQPAALVSQDDCINKGRHPEFFTARIQSEKGARRAAHNFHVGLTDMLDSSNTKKPTALIVISNNDTKSSLDDAEDMEDAMWYFRP